MAIDSLLKGLLPFTRRTLGSALNATPDPNSPEDGVQAFSAIFEALLALEQQMYQPGDTYSATSLYQQIQSMTGGTAAFITGTLAATISGDPTSCNVGSYDNVSNPGTPINVYQPSSAFFVGNSGARYHAIFSTTRAGGRWVFTWVDECH